MKTLKFYGASDDLVEVDGDIREEFDSLDKATVFRIAGLRVALDYGQGGCWGIKVRQIDEDTPVTAENIRMGVASEDPPDEGSGYRKPDYSMLLTMEVPDDAKLVREGQDA